MKDIIGLLALSWGLVLLVLIGITFLVVVPLAVRYAKKHGRSKWRWGIGAFLIIYLPIFWDWIPTVVVHKYYCAKEAGFWVYKTLDQWKVENPGVMEGLVANKVAIQRVGNDENHIDTVISNQRFNLVNERQQLIALLPVYGFTMKVVDSENGEVLARYSDSSSGTGRNSLKFWMRVQGCAEGTEYRIAYLKFSEQLTQMIGRTQRSIK